MAMIKPGNVEQYIAFFPEQTQKLLQHVRATIQKAAPGAEEVISYGMPAYKENGMLVYFAGYKNHIGFYPTGVGIDAFKKEIAGFKNSKGAVQFPLDEPMPVALITKMVKFMVRFNKEKQKLKK
jgi:uncharacterized protein YdhG (YjbR/CyaY superfamily)